jgi:hypothetical protein
MMDYQDFRRLVGDCRKAQKAYFRDRRTSDLDRSKRLERQIDEELNNNGQDNLFEKEQK